MARQRRRGRSPARSRSPEPSTSATSTATTHHTSQPSGPSSSSSKEGKQEETGPKRVTVEPKPLRADTKPYCPNFSIAFRCLLIPRIFAAILLPVADCDEVFNYWEPLHYAVNGSGLETWEYTPEYGLRSWLYIFIHYPFALFAGLAAKQKHQVFTIVRLILAFLAAAADAKLYDTCVKCINPRLGRYVLASLLCSAGIIQSSTALLPSSFASLTTSMAASYFFRGPSNTSRGGYVTQGCIWVAIGAIVGWPFAAALGIPFVLAEVLGADLRDPLAVGWRLARVQRLLQASLYCIPILVMSTVVDSYFYGRVIHVPFNLVRYNVLGASESAGPDIFGTEPWWYYLANLALNFNIIGLLALLSPVLLVLGYLCHPAENHPILRSVYVHLALKCAPVFLWLGIFSMQPHKEERFMTPVYPLIAFNAAASTYFLRDIGDWILVEVAPRLSLGITSPRVRARLLQTLTWGSFVLALGLSGSRLWGTYEQYGAVLPVWRELWEGTRAQEKANVCLGKEWYRFPSSFYLPPRMRVKFIRSAFDGLLPGEFIEEAPASKTGKAPKPWDVLSRPGYSKAQGRYNGENRSEEDKYVEESQCDYLIDVDFPQRYGANVEKDTSGWVEPRYAYRSPQWERLYCERFGDAQLTPRFQRILWLGEDDRRVWGEYCLLKAVKKV